MLELYCSNYYYNYQRHAFLKIPAIFIINEIFTMVILATKFSRQFKSRQLKPNQLTKKALRGSFIILAASTLFACNQADIKADSSAADMNSAQTQVSVNNTSADNLENTNQSATINAKAQHSDLLKNVSATVYKDVNCGCCKDWIEHAQNHGLTATSQHPKDLSLFKDRYGVPTEMRSCHTAVTTDGYVFEGHVPAKYVAQFLANPPAQAIGLAVPGMPVGSPGMEYQGQFAPYQIMQINKDGTNQVYADIESAEQQL